jgi:1-deoxy-D-xylulose-5-phosphate synthase
MARLIDSLELPAGLRALGAEELRMVAIELREELINTVASVGGHFASSLGVAELFYPIGQGYLGCRASGLYS